MCSGWMFSDCILVCFKLNVKYELIKLGKGGLQIYPRVLRVCPKINLYGGKEYVGWNGVSGAIVRNAPIRVWQRSVPRGHFSKVPASFGYFSTVEVWSRCWIFTWWFVNWGGWVLIMLVTQVLLIQLDWSDELQPSAEHTHWSLVDFSKF